MQYLSVFTIFYPFLKSNFPYSLSFKFRHRLFLSQTIFHSYPSILFTLLTSTFQPCPWIWPIFFTHFSLNKLPSLFMVYDNVSKECKWHLIMQVAVRATWLSGVFKLHDPFFQPKRRRMGSCTVISPPIRLSFCVTKFDCRKGFYFPPAAGAASEKPLSFSQ